MKRARYKLWIIFHHSGTWIIDFNNKKEALKYKSLIDHTVKAAWLEDTVNNKVDHWKENEHLKLIAQTRIQ